jgi:hypothetical protein
VILREEVLDAARRRGLNPQVIEKDYVLGWILMEIASHHGIIGANTGALSAPVEGAGVRRRHAALIPPLHC